MPRRSKVLTPKKILDAFFKVVYDKSTSEFLREAIFHDIPKEVEPEDITEDVVHEAMEEVFGDDYYEDQEFVNNDNAEYDGMFYRFDRKPRRQPRVQKVASEYADWFRYQARREQARVRGEVPPSDTIGDEITHAEACETLGVPPNADLPTIKKAFRRLARKWHPDVCEEGAKKGEEMFKKISMAYEFLCRTKPL